MKKQPVSFLSKHIITCPACETTFQKEELQTGRGRINAGDLTIELRRLYIPTQKYGVVNPLIYPILVCPSCLYAGFSNDFQKTPSEAIQNIQAEEENRHALIKNVFGTTIDFTANRDTVSGLAAYLLSYASTIHLPPIASPTAKRGLFSLRAAWLAEDLHISQKMDHFKELRDAFYYQAFINYESCLDKQIRKIEPFDGFVWMGPDVDANFGYDGLLYIISYLIMKHIDSFPPEEKIIKIGNVKRVLSKVFGIGKSTKNKPSILISNSKNLYIKAGKILSILAEQGLDISIADEIENQDDEE